MYIDPSDLRMLLFGLAPAPADGLAEAAKVQGVEIFHAGTEARDGRIFAAGLF